MVDGPVSLEVVAQDAQGMVKQARQLRSLGEQVVVKIPATQEGIKAVKILSQEGVPQTSHWSFSHYKRCWLPKLVRHMFHRL